MLRAQNATEKLGEWAEEQEMGPIIERKWEEEGFLVDALLAHPWWSYLKKGRGRSAVWIVFRIVQEADKLVQKELFLL